MATLVRRRPVLDVTAFHQLTPLKQRRYFGDIRLQLPDLPDEEQRRWERKLNRANSDCGCSMGTVFSMGALVLYLAWTVFARGMPGSSILTKAGYGLLVLTGAAVVGKLAGLMVARYRLRFQIDQLCKRYA